MQVLLHKMRSAREQMPGSALASPDFSHLTMTPEQEAITSLIVPGAGITPVKFGVDSADMRMLLESQASEQTVATAITAAHFITDSQVSAAFVSGEASGYGRDGQIYSTTEKAVMSAIIKMNLTNTRFNGLDLRVDPSVATNSFETMRNAGSFVEEMREKGAIGIVGIAGHTGRMALIGQKMYGRRTNFVEVTVPHSRASTEQRVLHWAYKIAFIGANGDALDRRNDVLHALLLDPLKARTQGNPHYS